MSWLEDCTNCGSWGHVNCGEYTASCPGCGEDATFRPECVYEPVKGGYYFKTNVVSIACARCDA